MLPQEKNYQHCGHLRNTIQREIAEPLIKQAVREIKKSGIEFDAFAFCGLSGALLAPILAHKFEKDILAIRKKGELRLHGNMELEGNYAASRVIIVDDLVDSGKTLGWMLSQLRRRTTILAPVALLMYHWSMSYEGQESEVLFLPDSKNYQIWMEQGLLYFEVLS